MGGEEQNAPAERRPLPMLSDGRVRLGITLGVLVFCMGTIVYALVSSQPASTQAWDVLWIVVVAMLGFGSVSDYVRK